MAWQPAEIRGNVDDDHAFVTVAGSPVELHHGQFSALVQPPFSGPVKITATDVAGNRSVKDVDVWVVPRRPAVALPPSTSPPMRGPTRRCVPGS